MTEIEISYHFCRLVEYTCGVHKLKMNKEGVGIELDRLVWYKNVQLDVLLILIKFTVPDPIPTLSLSIFQIFTPHPPIQQAFLSIAFVFYR